MELGSFASGGDGDVDRTLYTMQPEEGQRYAAFFATLDPAAPHHIAKATAIEFFAKSSLSDMQVDALYNAIKGVGVTADALLMNETEFIMGMHLIVCLTKRGLASLPPRFPVYLFPTLPLPPLSSHADLISGMPSPEKPRQSSFTKSSSPDESTGAAALGDLPKLADARSLVDLAQKDANTNHILITSLAQLEESETNVLQHLHATLASLAHAVEQLGFAVPPSSYATIGSLDEFGNLLRTNVQSLKQEIQSMEISVQMLSIADEATQRTNSGGATIESNQPSDGIAQIASLTQQLAALQNESAQLQQKKETLSTQALERSKAAVTSAAAAMTTATPSIVTANPPAPPPMKPDVAAPPLSSSSSIGVPVSSSDWGDFGSSPSSVPTPVATTDFPSPSAAFGFDATVPVTTASAATDDFGWGAFQ